jgi:acetoacetyl-CoA synthetase
MVVAQPMPCMPVGFWDDPSGARYRAAYFETFPGLWRHGDWITISPRDTCVISGRSDATLNRGSVRIGTAELYNVLAELDDVSDSLVVHLEDPTGGSGELVLFVQLAGASAISDELR